MQKKKNNEKTALTRTHTVILASMCACLCTLAKYVFRYSQGVQNVHSAENVQKV